MSLLPCCPYHPAGMSCRIGQPTPCHVAFVRREKTRLPDLIFFRGHFWVHFRCSPVTRSPSLTMALSVGFTSFVSSTDATQAKGLLTFTPIGLPPIEHVCLSWTHVGSSVTGHTVFPRRCPLFPLPHFRSSFLCDRAAVLREHASGIGYSPM